MVPQLPLLLKSLCLVMEFSLLPILMAGSILIRICSTFHRRFSKPSIFMGTIHINNWVHISQGLHRKGYPVKLVVWNPPEHEIGVVEYDMVLSQRYPYIFRSSITRYLFTYPFFLWAIWKHDLFIMCFLSRLLDRTYLIRWFEFQLLRIAGKRIILNTYGADIMTPKITLGKKHKYSVLDGYLKDIAYSTIDEQEIARNRTYCQRWADYIISAIDHVEYLERVDELFHMRCVNTDNLIPLYRTQNKIPIIVHAPNHRLLKGTEYLIRAVDELKGEGIRCELKILERLSHKEVVQEITNADIVADQFLIGAYARFAIEAMALGKPVLCYLREDLFRLNPIWNECPIINANPDNLKNKLKDLILMTQDELSKIGFMGRTFIERYHSINYVTKKLEEIVIKVMGQKTSIYGFTTR